METLFAKVFPCRNAMQILLRYAENVFDQKKYTSFIGFLKGAVKCMSIMLARIKKLVFYGLFKVA